MGVVMRGWLNKHWGWSDAWQTYTYAESSSGLLPAC